LIGPAHGRSEDNGHFDLYKQGKRESALLERVRAMGNHYANACLGRGRSGVRYRGDVGEREIRAGLRQHIAPFDFGKVRETRNGGNKICGTKSHCRAALRGFRGHGDGAAGRKYDQARALRRSLNIAMWHDRIPVDHFGS
jgi:hypothetical protein